MLISTNEITAGADPGYYNRGGGGGAHHEREARNLFNSAGVHRARLKALEFALKGLRCSLSLMLS